MLVNTSLKRERENREAEFMVTHPHRKLTFGLIADLKLTNGGNPVLPNASYQLSSENSLMAGRFVVAQHPVKTGDTLVIEAPYAACLLPEKFGPHCHHCFKR